MNNTITYKSFIGSLQFNQSDKTFFGKIEGINDLVTFEGKSVSELIKAFHEAVDDYLVLCKLKKKEPHKSFKGSFNVRVAPEIHARAYHSAKSLNLSLNQFVRKSIEKSLSEGLKN
jgi:predicted HicB family RNase H-like nuclease